MKDAKPFPDVQKLFDTLMRELPWLGYETVEDFVAEAVRMRFERLMPLLPSCNPQSERERTT